MKRGIGYLLILALVFCGIWLSLREWPVAELLPTTQTETVDESDNVSPKNIIQIGDSFMCYPVRAEGHLLCKVTDVRLVREESLCPPEEAFCGKDILLVHGDENEDPEVFRYEEWFSEGGAFEQGARILLVDLEVTNADAVALLSDGTWSETDGYFRDADAFHSYMFVDTADMSKCYTEPDGTRVVSGWQSSLIYFSREGAYEQEELRDTPGQESQAVQIPMGQTVCFTLGYSVDGTGNAAPDLSDLWLTVLPGRNIAAEGLRDLDTSVFIDTKLGRNEE